LNLTKTFFDVAMHWEYIYRNPAYTIELPRLPKSKRIQVDPLRIITMIEDIDSLLDKTAIACGFYGLLRIGETFALERKNIDLKLNVIHITQRVYRGKLGSPKTASSEASVYMIKPFARIMKEWILQCPSNQWIFPGARTKDLPMSHGAWYKANFKPICKKYGLDITYHSLRHLGIQFLRNSGLSPDYIQSQARHATIRTTFDVYSGVSQNQTLEDRKKIESSLKKIITNPDYQVLENRE
jgi:integrase